MSWSLDLPCSALTEHLRRTLPDVGVVSMSPMAGGASTRCFGRINYATDRTAVVMFVPEATQSDEIAKGDESGRRWPFLEVQQLLEQRGVRVPKILAEACHLGCILVEDLGSTTLASALAQEPQARTALYRLAVRDLARAQRALADMPDDCVVRARAFDKDLLRWEVDHFREWGLEARGIQLLSAERQVFDQAADYLADTIAAWPRSFVHRDYQSRNLMVLRDDAGEPELVWIDFQDALMGPRVYDLVALLGDSYQTFEPEFVEARLSDYADAMELCDADRAQLRYEFQLVTVQRKLKDAGRFVFLDRVRNNPAFLEYVEPTITKVFRALAQLRSEPRLAGLEDLLFRRLA